MTETVLTIARMHPEDIPEVAALEKQVYVQPWSEASFAEILARPYSLYVAARTGGRLAGYAGLLRSGDEADITHVVTSPDCRRQGVGRAMLSRLLQEGGREGIRSFTLEVRVSNEGAIALYHQAGFEDCGVRPHFYQYPTEDALIMWRRDTTN